MFSIKTPTYPIGLPHRIGTTTDLHITDSTSVAFTIEMPHQGLSCWCYRLLCTTTPPLASSLLRLHLAFLSHVFSCYCYCYCYCPVSNPTPLGLLSRLQLTSLNDGLPFYCYCPVYRRKLTAVRHRCAQLCDSENEHSVVTAMVLIVLLQRRQ